MSLFSGKINDSIHKGLFVNGKREGYHKIQYLYFDKDTILYQAKGEFVNNKYVGLWSFYSKNDKLRAKGNFKESKGEKLGYVRGEENERNRIYEVKTTI